MSIRYVWEKYDTVYGPYATLGHPFTQMTATTDIPRNTRFDEYDNVKDYVDDTNSTRVFNALTGSFNVVAGKYYSGFFYSNLPEWYCQSSGAVSVTLEGETYTLKVVSGSVRRISRKGYANLKGDELLGTVSNAASSTYPLNNNCCRIAKICVILPLLFWGYRHVK